MKTTKFPHEIFSGEITNCNHCQGIATDGEYMYYSFTSKLVKTDMQGNLIASAIGLTGHLGCIAYNEEDKCVYGSLEYKNDVIGKGIRKELGIEGDCPDGFYIARFDTTLMNSDEADAIDSGIMTLLRLKDVVDDYLWTDGTTEHKLGCSGIDGTTIVPDYHGKRMLFVAYGIYSDLNRDDNDDQVIVAYDMERVVPLFSKIYPSNDHTEGVTADKKLFVYTGNTTFGVQNLEYDAHTGCILAAVYRGQKPQYPNRNMYFIDMNAPEYEKDGKTYLPLAKRGLPHESGIYGSDFPYGATGVIALGDGYYYFSDANSKAGVHTTLVKLYKLSGDGDFELA